MCIMNWLLFFLSLICLGGIVGLVLWRPLYAPRHQATVTAVNKATGAVTYQWSDPLKTPPTNTGTLPAAGARMGKFAVGSTFQVVTTSKGTFRAYWWLRIGVCIALAVAWLLLLLLAALDKPAVAVAAAAGAAQQRPMQILLVR